MNIVTFEKVLILDVRAGTSQRGNLWVNLQFLDQDTLQVFNLMQFGDAAAAASGITKGAVMSLGFDCVPDRNGGVRLDLIQVGPVV